MPEQGSTPSYSEFLAFDLDSCEQLERAYATAIESGDTAVVTLSKGQYAFPPLHRMVARVVPFSALHSLVDEVTGRRVRVHRLAPVANERPRKRVCVRKKDRDWSLVLEHATPVPAPPASASSSSSSSALSSSTSVTRVVGEDLHLHECSICLDEFEDEPSACVKLKACQTEHYFHHKCIVDWMERAKGDTVMCPVCMLEYKLPVQELEEYEQDAVEGRGEPEQRSSEWMINMVRAWQANANRGDRSSRDNDSDGDRLRDSSSSGSSSDSERSENALAAAVPPPPSPSPSPAQRVVEDAEPTKPRPRAGPKSKAKTKAKPKTKPKPKAKADAKGKKTKAKTKPRAKPKPGKPSGKKRQSRPREPVSARTRSRTKKSTKVDP